MENYVNKLKNLHNKFRKQPSKKLSQQIADFVNTDPNKLQSLQKSQQNFVQDLCDDLQNFQKNQNYGTAQNAEETSSLLTAETDDQILDRILKLSTQTKHKSIHISDTLREDTNYLIQFTQQTNDIKSNLKLTEKQTMQIFRNLRLDKFRLFFIIIFLGILDMIALYIKIKHFQLNLFNQKFATIIHKKWATNVNAKKLLIKSQKLRILQFNKSMEELVNIRNQNHRKSIQIDFLGSQIDKINQLDGQNSNEIMYEDGSKYIGETLNNQRHGKGKLIVPNVFIYQGEFKFDKMEGKGKLVLQDGTSYEGEFKDGYQHGYGVEKFPDGSSYQGYYKDGDKNGQGTYNWATGSSYHGELQNGILQGFGQYISSQNSCYKGEWKNNKKNGHGQKKSQNGQIYIGQYKSDIKNGHGILISQNQKYEGQFQEDKPNGFGVLTQKDGTLIEGQWNDGNLVQQKQLIFNTFRAISQSNS